MNGSLVHRDERSFLVRFPDSDTAARSAAAMRRTDGVEDALAAYDLLAVSYNPLRTDPDTLLQRLEQSVEVVPTPDSTLHTLPVLYDGDDLTAVAERLALSVDDVIAAHAGREYRVEAIDFMPGFPYAGPLPQSLRGLARRAEPRPRVPAGSVAIAGRQTAIYPRESPGGWQLIGRTPLAIVDLPLGRFPIQVGDRLRFEPIDANRFHATAGRPLWHPPST